MNETIINPKERVLQNATMFFATKGYYGTTLRMIANESNVALSAIPFYFESKEKLYESVIIRAALIIKNHNKSLSDEIQETLSNEYITKDTYWNYMVELVSLHVEWCFNRENLYEKKLISREHQFTSDSLSYISDAIIEYVLLPMSNLIIGYTGTENHEWARTYVFQMIGSFLTYYNEAPMLLALANCDVDDPETNNRLKRRAKFDFLHSLKATLDSPMTHL